MRTTGRRISWLAVLTLAGLGTPTLFALTPQNQCGGDCSPCLGPTDPFCSSTTIDATSTSGRFCVLCESAKGNCRDANAGESGKDQSCTVETKGMTVISCTNSGNPCTGSSVTP